MSSHLKIKVRQQPKRIDVDIAVSISHKDLPLIQDEAVKKHGIAVIDTGATRTLVCHKILESLQVLPNGSASMIGIFGGPKIVNTFSIDLHFVGGENSGVVHTVKNVDVVPLDNSETAQVLIGMDVLMSEVKTFTLSGINAELVF
jgi:hypothetical protein